MGGGKDWREKLTSTEIYSTAQLKWNDGVPLPKENTGSNGISLNNNVFLLGKKQYLLFLTSIMLSPV